MPNSDILDEKSISEIETLFSIQTIIYVINELFISNNDLVALDWIEHEYCKTGRRKWDGVILKVNNHQFLLNFLEDQR